MNKKLQKGLVAAVAATLSTGIVAPVYAASVETKSFDAQYAEAYNATVNAKTQKELTAARVLVDKLYADLPQDLKNLAATLSAILDPKQQTELVKLDDAIKAAEALGTQKNVNAARALIVDMPTVWKNSFSSYIDTIQQALVNKAVEAAKKAQTSGAQADLDAAKALYEELLTVTNNDGVKSFVETAVKAELDKVVVKTVVKEIKAVGAKKLEVSFNNPVIDTAKMVLSVKRDNITVSVASVEWNAAKTVATLTTSTSLQTGKYVATAKYDVEEATKTVETELKAAKVSKVTFVSPVAVITDSSASGASATDKKAVKFSIKVENQYGENVTDSVTKTDLTVTPSNGSYYSLNKGTVVVEASSDYTVDSKVVVTVVHNATATVATETLTVSQAASVKSIEIGALTTDNEDLKGKDLFVSTDHKEFYLPVTVLDQYGNELGADALNASNFTILSSNKKIVKVSTTFKEDSDGNVYLELLDQDTTETYGTAVITLVSANGVSANTNIAVKEDGKIDSLVIDQPSVIVKQGKAVKLPFTAIDQYGNQLVSAADLVVAGTDTNLTVNTDTTISVTNGKIVAKVDYANKNARVLELTPNAGVDNVIITVITATGKVQNLTINVEDSVVPASISGLDTTFNKAYQIDQFDTLTDAEVLLKDQYGDDIDLPTGYSINVVSVDTTATNVVLGSGNKFTAKVKGTEQFKVQLIKTADASVIDEYTFTTEAVELKDITSFEINSLKKQYTGAVDSVHKQTVSVYGLKGTTKVQVDQNLIKSVAISGSLDLEFVAGETAVERVINSTLVDTDGADKTAKLTVVVEGYDAPVTLTKDVVYSDATPKAASVVIKDASDNEITAPVVTLDIAKLDTKDITKGYVAGTGLYFYVLDQYGKEIEDLTFTVTNAVNYDKDTTVPTPSITTAGAVSLTGVEAGDSFIINALSSTGIAKTLKVFVK